MELTQTENKVLGYIALHPNCQETTLCTALRLHIHDVWAAIKTLQAAKLIESMGYAAHTQEWHVIDQSRVNVEAIGKLYAGGQ